MPFIGIISKESESNFIKNEVLKNFTKNKIEFININQRNIQNLKNIKFEIIVINENIESFLDTSKYLEEILGKSKYLIVNSDVVDNINTLELLSKDSKIITYGLNQQAIVTISSIEQENVLICIQKEFENINGKKIEQQELNIEITKNSTNKTYNSMVIFTILAIYGYNSQLII